jgi:hypothetical protein
VKKQPDLGKLVEAARLKVMTPGERERQRRSFAYGNANLSDGRVTRAVVERAANECPPATDKRRGRELAGNRKRRPGPAARAPRRRRRAGRALSNFFRAVGYRVGERWHRTGSLEGSLSEIFSDVAGTVAGGASIADRDALGTSPGDPRVEGELPPVTGKRRSHELWTSGAYGNRLRSWGVGEWRRSGFTGLVALRELGWTGEGHCSYYLRPAEVEVELCMWLSLGVRLENVIVCEQAPDDRLVVCGEYHHDLLPDGTFRHLFYSRVRRSMRFALREGGRVASGLRATAILREAMTDRSWADFGELVLAYPGHVVEVSVYDHCLGDLPGRNALVWEVRRY